LPFESSQLLKHPLNKNPLLERSFYI
jgi:hypothetical protein